jgi:ubiquinone/menaquinone biosynthesis C-methylase UbiE
MNRQQYWRQIYKERRPEWDSSTTVYRRLIGEKVDETTRVLDIGCGHAGYLKEVYDRTPFSYGVDPDADALANNTTIKNTVLANAEDLPFEDEFFDVVALAWVLEHLEDPEQVFREIYRVLKPHGTVFFLTPNAWNYNVWLIRALPNASHQYLARRLYQRPEHDAFPTRYKMNSPTRVEKLLTKVGFERERLILNGDPSYISFSRPLFAVACFLERILDIGFAKKARVHIIGAYRKAVVSPA